ncbi:hypothetical protein Vretimale_4684 [Volvox reticuliferus]|uniref:Uncharacterized protein n=1 Tax=Volvox reticuliferus TaxID=1737510 RepID=A0A8J4C240_9CHLO|nr:hypothetical protein Vretifemale_3288 [Volvox reticuliferus]GIL99543.1 hypothetical protein Vretimale_4684 [Volvox reticuliferus]
MLQLLSGTGVSCNNVKTRSEGGASALSKNCCSEGGDLWSPASSILSRLPGSARRTRDSTSGSLLNLTLNEVPAELELGDLHSRLEVVTRQLAERDEMIENLSSELAAFKALYKEAILEMNRPKQVGSSALRTSSPNLITPDRPIPFRTKSVMNLRVTNCDLAKDSSPFSTAAANPLAGKLSVTASVGTGTGAMMQPQGGSLGLRLGRSYSWREGGRSRGTPATQKPVI